MKVTANSDTYLQVMLNAGGHALTADEPESAGGHDTGPNPYGLLLSALAACKIMTTQIADRCPVHRTLTTETRIRTAVQE